MHPEVGMQFRLANLVRNGICAVGTWMELFDSGVVHVLANAGFDWFCIDTEHSPLDETQLCTCVCAAASAGISPVVRVRQNDEAMIKLAQEPVRRSDGSVA